MHSTLPFAIRAAAVCTALALTLARVPDADATREAPPAAHTGGFGEPTCTQCHMQAEPNTGAGKVIVEGLPEAWEAGASYTLTVTVTQPGLAGGGFQLAARFNNGTQAGTFSVPVADTLRMGVITADDVQYVHHLADGTLPTSRDTVKWTVQWKAPRTANGRVLFHAAVNATNDDLSPFGDFVYTREVVSAGTVR